MTDRVAAQRETHEEADSFTGGPGVVTVGGITAGGVSGGFVRPKRTLPSSDADVR